MSREQPIASAIGARRRPSSYIDHSASRSWARSSRRPADGRPALRRALVDAGMAGDHLTFHGLRHTFASLLIAQGEDVGWVAGQLGHTDPTTTLRTYQHLFDAVRHAAESSARMEAAYGNFLENSGGNGRQDGPALRVVEGA